MGCDFFSVFFLIVLSKLCVNGKSWRGRQLWDESIDTDLHNSTGLASSSHAGPIHRLLSVHIMTSGFFFLPQFREGGGLVVIIHKRNEPNLAKAVREQTKSFLESCSLLATSSRNLLFKYGDFRVFFPSKCGEFLRFSFPPKESLECTLCSGFLFLIWGRRGVKFRQIFLKHTALMTLSMLMAIVCKLSLHTNRWSDEFSFLLPAVDDDACRKEKKMRSVHAGEERK